MLLDPYSHLTLHREQIRLDQLERERRARRPRVRRARRRRHRPEHVAPPNGEWRTLIHRREAALRGREVAS